MDGLGVDIGGVIIDHVSDDGRAALENRFATTARVRNAFETIARLVEARFGERVWVVSRTDATTEPLLLEWLEREEFFGLTGVARDRVRFCRRRAEKAEICRALGITHFVDDRLEVLSHLVGTVPHLYLFRSRARDVDRFGEFLPRVRQVETWDDVLDDLLPHAGRSAVR